MLGVRRFGTGPLVVALHGFTLTGDQFASAGALIARTVVAPDLPGHGRSADASTKIADVIEAVASIVDSLGHAVPIIGYSQGGRLALMTALDRPEGISALVLVSATAGIEDAAAREARRRSDAVMASALRTGTIDEFLDSWTSAGTTSTAHLTTAERASDMAIRHQNSPHGLAAAVTGYGQGAQPSLWDRLTGVTIPVLVMTGSQDDKYSLIAKRLASSLPDAELATIDDAGHNPLLDAPDQAYATISDFLDRRS